MLAEGFFVWFFSIAPAVTAGQRGRVPVGALFIHADRFWFARTGRLLECAEPCNGMWQRLAWAAMLSVSLVACQETKIDDPTLISGSGPVAVLQSSYVSSGESQAALGAGSVTYVISRVELTDDQAAPLYPVIAHFFLTDRSGNRYFGIDTGSAALTGLANDLSPLRPGEKRKFVVGFRAGATTMGTIRYNY